MLNAIPWLAGLLACTGTSSVDSPPQDSPADTADTNNSVDTGPFDTGPFDTTGLNGEEVDPRLAAPVFDQVLASDDSARSQADLMGHPTVIWFYPAAESFG
ncbi:MAG: hypothetical protein ACI9VR_000171 [Cognaticolwellia sp.]|jgi:hypothetical protein